MADLLQAAQMAGLEPGPSDATSDSKDAFNDGSHDDNDDDDDDSESEQDDDDDDIDADAADADGFVSDVAVATEMAMTSVECVEKQYITTPIIAGSAAPCEEGSAAESDVESSSGWESLSDGCDECVPKAEACARQQAAASDNDDGAGENDNAEDDKQKDFEIPRTKHEIDDSSLPVETMCVSAG